MNCRIEIDPHSGFCYGVVKAIEKAENSLKKKHRLYSLGDIVHNDDEVKRLASQGMLTIDHLELNKKDTDNVLFRAHGEPPESYEKAREKGLDIIDATCPVVLKLQGRIKKAYDSIRNENGQLVIFGKKGHPEVIGLNGQIENKAIILESIADVDIIDFKRPVELFAQTTKDVEQFRHIVDVIKERIERKELFRFHDTICRQVSNRIPWIKDFAAKYDVVVFVGGDKSSNAKVLFKVCLEVNKRSYFVSAVEGLKREWFLGIDTVGITGATSTPEWQLRKVQEAILTLS